LIYSLVDKNIIRSLPDSPTAETRFRLLQTLREYGLEKLEQSPASNEIRQRYALYYLAFTRQAEEGLRAGEQAFWLARLREEDANIMAALAWLAAHLDDPEKGRLAARLVSSLERFWSLQGRFGEAHTWYGRVLPLAHLLPADEQIKLLNKAGVIAQHMGDYATAAVYHTTALSLARQTSEPLALAQTLHYLGFAAGRQGEYDEARTLLEESLACYRLLPGDQTAAITTLLNNLSIVYRRQGQIKQAVAVLTEALALKRQLNDQIGLPAVLGNLGQLLAAQGDVAQATAYVREGLQIRRALQDQPGLLTSIEQMADLFWQGGRFLPALTLFAATAHQRQIMHLPLTAQVQMEREEILAKLRAATGDAAYTAVWATRERISLDTAVQLALDESK
jgi:non-specific serine/threonine protein kinase